MTSSFVEIPETKIFFDTHNNNFDNININNIKNTNFTKHSLFDKLSVRGIDFEMSQFNSGLSLFCSTALRTEFIPQSEIFYNTSNYCYNNYNQDQTNSITTSPTNLRTKFQQHKYNLKDSFRRKFSVVGSDFRNFYSYDSLGNLFVVFCGSAVLANTSLDANFHNWFYKNISLPNKRHSTLNDFSAFTKEFGELSVILFFTIATAGYKFLPSCLPAKCENSLSPVGEYVTMVSRSFLVGAPINLLGQLCIGAGRPSSGSSYWFKGGLNGISGHAFVGAVPFITAAQMTDNCLLKFIFYTCSTLTATSRLYENSHYLSQVLLGWYLAYMSVRATSKTEGKKLTRGLTIFPIIEKEHTGIGLVFKF
ncbi:MAG: phosphatase PAP2 family protein [Planctomycetaceae bacterium]|nr:phosphatase PAP2 family protein [Planctomycetaceae bacterium]